MLLDKQFLEKCQSLVLVSKRLVNIHFIICLSLVNDYYSKFIISVQIPT